MFSRWIRYVLRSKWLFQVNSQPNNDHANSCSENTSNITFTFYQLHLILFIRDAALGRLVSSLKYSPFYTRSVSYSSLIFWTNPYSLSLISYQQQKTANHSITISENECIAWGDIWVLNFIKFSYQSQCCVQTQFSLVPTKLQVVSPIWQISVISYFFRGN